MRQLVLRVSLSVATDFVMMKAFLSRVAEVAPVW